VEDVKRRRLFTSNVHSRESLRSRGVHVLKPTCEGADRVGAAFVRLWEELI